MKYRSLIVFILVLCFGVFTAWSGARAENGSLSYDDIKGSGLANICPQLPETNLDSIAVTPKQSYQLKELCLQPEVFLVKQPALVKREESKFVPAKLLTRKSFTLDQISGPLQIGPDGNLTFAEQGGFDFQPVTVQMPDGERVPILFTVKGLVAKNSGKASNLSPSTRLEGTFKVPPYRTSNFIDSKGRGLASGYDAAMGLPIQADSEEFARQNLKSFDMGQGRISLQISRVDSDTGEIAGLFESEQLSDTDFGAKEPMDVKIQGQFYGRVDQEIT